MTDIPQEALQAALAHVASQTLLWQYVSEEDVRDILGSAAPAFAVREEEIRADERRKVAEQIAAAIEAVDPVEWALAGQHAGKDAADIARKIGEGRDSR